MAAAVAASGCIHGDGEVEEGEDGEEETAGDGDDGSREGEDDGNGEGVGEGEHTGFVPDGEAELETPRSIEMENDLEEPVTIEVELYYEDDEGVEHEIFSGARTVEGMGYEFFGAVVEHHGSYVVHASHDDQEAVEPWEVDDEAGNAIIVVERVTGDLWIDIP